MGIPDALFLYCLSSQKCVKSVVESATGIDHRLNNEPVHDFDLLIDKAQAMRMVNLKWQLVEFFAKTSLHSNRYTMVNIGRFLSSYNIFQ